MNTQDPLALVLQQPGVHDFPEEVCDECGSNWDWDEAHKAWCSEVYEQPVVEQ